MGKCTNGQGKREGETERLSERKLRVGSHSFEETLLKEESENCDERERERGRNYGEAGKGYK